MRIRTINLIPSALKPYLAGEDVHQVLRTRSGQVYPIRVNRLRSARGASYGTFAPPCSNGMLSGEAFYQGTTQRAFNGQYHYLPLLLSLSWLYGISPSGPKSGVR